MKGFSNTGHIFENILQGITDSVLLLSKDFEILWANKAFQNQTGYKKKEIIGNYCYKLTHQQKVPCQSPHDLCPIAEALENGRTATTIHTHFDKEGNKIFVEVSAHPLKDEKGDIIRFVYIYRDITEMKKLEEELRSALIGSQKRQAEILALFEGSRAILKYHDFDSTARAIFDSCKNLIGATSGYVALLSEDGTENKVLFLDSGGLACTVDPTLPMPIRGLRGEAYNQVKTFYHNDFSRSEWMKFMPAGHVRLGNVLFAPMVVEGKAVGLLGLANKRGDFNEYDARMASAFAELAAIALLNKRAEEELRRTRDELEMRVLERTEELANVNKELQVEIHERRQTERHIKATNILLKLSVKKSSRKEYLDSVVKLISDWSSCCCVGIRVLNIYGSIPFESYTGYSQEFWESENWLSVKEHQCACIRVIQERPEPQDLQAMTPEGSFRCDNTIKFFGALSEKEKGRFRGVCLQSGFISLAIIPIRHKGAVVGAVHLADKKEGMVPLKTVEFIESISPLIGETVYRFSTEEELSKYQYHLEELVEERTAMLKAATEKLQQEIIERTKMEEALRKAHCELEIRVKERTAELEKVNEELMQSYEQLRKLSAHLQSVREEERTNIAREIHDELGQVLTALKIDVSMLSNKLYPDRKLLEKTESIIKRIDETIQSVKRICTELRPTILDHFGLSAAIEWHVEEFESRTGIKCNVSFEPRKIVLDQDLTTSVFRIFQEALTNVARHANATEVRISLKLKDGNIRLEVKDNGKGFKEKQFSDPKSFGLIGIKERVNFFGGNVKINGIRNKGTTMTVNIPLKKKEELNDKNIDRR